MKLSILHKGLIIVFVPLLVQVVCIAALYSVQSQVEKELDREHHSRLIIETADKTVKNLYFGVGGLKGGSKFNMGDFNHAFNTVNAQTRESLGTLELLVQDRPDELAIVKSIEKKLYPVFDQFVAARKMVRNGETDRAVISFHDTIREAKDVAIAASNELVQLVEREKQIEQESPSILKSKRDQLKTGLLIGILADVVLALLLAIVFNKSIASRIKTVSDNFIRFASGKELQNRLSGSDELARMDSAFRDLTRSLEEARAHEKALVENARELICSLSADLKFLSVNPAVEVLIGYTSEELLGARFISILDPASIDASLEYLNELQESNAIKFLENKVVCKNGSERFFAWSVQWSEQKKNYFCVAHDVTAARDLERMKQEFIAMVSHDLRSPLNSIQAYTELLEMGIYGELTDEGTGSLRNVNLSIGRLINLVSDLIDIEQLESGKLNLHVEKVSVKNLFDGAVQSIGSLAGSKSIKIEVEDRNLFAELDERRMIQVLVNLLSNAIKFSPDYSTVRLEAQNGNGVLKLAVIDKGRGIPTEQLDSVFERFKQVKTSDADQRKGSGLGLSICKAIVEQHQGSISVESKVGSGSTFWITLPKNLQ